MKTPKTNKYKKCKECYKMYPDDTDHFHTCSTYDLYVTRIKRLMERKGSNLTKRNPQL